MQDFTGVPAVVDLAAMRDAMAAARRRPRVGQPADPGRAGDRPLGHRRRLRHPRRLRPQRRARVRAQRGALPVPAVGPGRLRRASASCRPTPASATRSTSSTWPGWCSPTDDGPGLPRHPGRHRLAHHDGQRPRRARLGRRRHRGRGGHARPARLDAHPQGRRLPADGALPEGTTATDLVLTVTELLREPRGGRQVRGVLRTGRGHRPAREPGHDRQHVARVRLDLHHLPDRRRDAAVPAASPGGRPSRSRWSRPTPRSRVCGTTRATSRCSPSASSSTCRRSCPAWPGPSRPQDRVPLDRGASAVRLVARHPAARSRVGPAARTLAPLTDGGLDEASAESFPASDPPAAHGPTADTDAAPVNGTAADPEPPVPAPRADPGRPRRRHDVRARPRPRRHRRHHQLHQHVQPVGDARRRPAGQEGRRARPDARSRGSRPRSRPAPRSSSTTTSGPGCTPYLDKLGFNLVGYGCTTCIGNSGPLAPEIRGGRTSTAWPWSPCSPATATSRAASTPTCA